MTPPTTTETRESLSRRAFLSLFTNRAAVQILEPMSGAMAVLAADPAKSQDTIDRPAARVPAPGERAPPASPEAARRLAYFRAASPAPGKADP